MSADNWTGCPRCWGEHVKADPVGAAKKLYGTIPLEEFEAAMGEAENTPAPGSSLREDYTFYLDGFCLQINYSCSCETCGFTFSFNKKVDVPH